MPHQNAGAAVDETLRQPLMQSIAEPVLDVARLFAPMRWVFKPVLAVGDKGPCADLAHPVGEGIDVAGSMVAEPYLLGNPVDIDPSVADEVEIDAGDDFSVVSRRNITVVGDLAALPE